MRTKGLKRRISNIVLLGVLLVIAVGIYFNIYNSKAENVVEIPAIALDNYGYLEDEEFNLEAKEPENDVYEIELPESINGKKVVEFLKVTLETSVEEPESETEDAIEVQDTETIEEDSETTGDTEAQSDAAENVTNEQEAENTTTQNSTTENTVDDNTTIENQIEENVTAEELETEIIEVEIKDNKIQLTKEQVETKKINIEVKYDVAILEKDEEGKYQKDLIAEKTEEERQELEITEETEILYNKVLKYEDEENEKQVELRGFLPLDAELKVEEVTEEKLKEIFGDGKIDVAYDIKILIKEIKTVPVDENDPEGETKEVIEYKEINPEDFGENCEVSIKDSNIEENSKIYHVKEDNSFEKVDIKENTGESISFDASNFSVYALSADEGIMTTAGTAESNGLTFSISGTNSTYWDEIYLRISGYAYSNYWYKWTTSTAQPSVSYDGRAFNTNGIDLSKSGATGIYYLHVWVVEDGDSYTRTQDSSFYKGYAGPYRFDNTDPTAATMTMKNGSSTGTTYTNDTWTSGNVYIYLNNDASDSNAGVLPSTYSVNGTTASGTSQTLTSEGTYDIVVTTKDKTYSYDSGSDGVSDQGANTATRSYKVKIDKNNPTQTTYYAYYADGSGAYGGEWTNKKVNTRLRSTDTGSGISYFQYKKSDATSWTTASLDGNGISKSGTTYTGYEPWTLRDREDTYVFRAVDVSGKASTQSSSFTVRYDLTAPTGLTLSATKADETAYTSGYWTNQNVTLTASGATDALSGFSKYQYSTDNSTWTDMTNGTVTLSSNMNGTVYVRALDKAGNASTTSISVKIDKNAPTGTLTASATLVDGEYYTKQSTVTLYLSNVQDTGGSGLSHTAMYGWFGNSDENQNLAAKWASPTWEGSNNRYYHTYTFSELPHRNGSSSSNNGDGLYEFDAHAYDNAGNDGYIPKIQVYYDTTSPTITSVTGNPTSWVRTDVTLTVNVSDNLAGVKYYSFDNGATWQESNQKTFTTNQTVNIKVKDRAGNISSTTAVEITKIDKTAPNIEILGQTGIVTNGLIRRYEANNNTGSGHDYTADTWKDLSGNKDATINGGANFANHILSLDGSDDYADLGPIYDWNYHTLQTSVIETSVQSGQHMILANCQSGGSALFIEDGVLAYENYINGQYQVLYGRELEIGRLYNITATYDGTAMKLYIDGELDTSMTISGDIGATQTQTYKMLAGANPTINGAIDNGYYGNIKIVDILIYNRALTQNEIKRNMTKTVKQDGLIRNYDAVNNTGSGHSTTTRTWKDLSGNCDAIIEQGINFTEDYLPANWASVDIGKLDSTMTSTTIELEFSYRGGWTSEWLNMFSGGTWDQTNGGYIVSVINSDTNNPQLTVPVWPKGQSATNTGRNYLIETGKKYKVTVAMLGSTSSTQIVIYVNGNMVASKTVSGTWSYGLENASLGVMNFYSARVYNRYLSPAEVYNNYFAENEDTTVWSKTKDVTVQISDWQSGLATGAQLQYGWSTSKETLPTSWTDVTVTGYSAGETTATFVATTSGLNGKYYLHVKPVDLRDTAVTGGNAQTSNTVSNGTYWLDNTAPQIALLTQGNSSWVQATSVGVKITDTKSGIDVGATVKYGWSTSNTTAPTSWYYVTVSNYNAGANEAAFTAYSNGASGKLYLWVTPVDVRDLSVVGGNAQTRATVSTGIFWLDYKNPVIKVDGHTIGSSTVGAGIVEDGLIRHYDAINNTGEGHSNSATTWKDLTGNYDATVNGGATFGKDDISFDGVNDWVDCGTPGELDYVTMSVKVMLKGSYPDGVEVNDVFTSGPGYLGITINEEGCPSFQWKREGQTQFEHIESDEPLEYNRIYDITATFDGNQAKLYVDGICKVIGNSTGTIDNSSTTKLSLGAFAWEDGTLDYKGNYSIYSAMLYDRALTPAEIQQNIAATIAIEEEDLIRHYSASNNLGNGFSSSATKWKDLTGNYDAELYGAVWGDENVKLDGVDDYVNLGEITELNTPTLQMNVMLNSIQTGQRCMLANSENGGVELLVNQGVPGATIYITENKQYTILMGTKALDVGRLYNITSTYDGANFRLYVDGVLENEMVLTGTVGQPNSSPKNMNIGTSPGADGLGDNPYSKTLCADITVEDVLIYNAPLTHYEIHKNILTKENTIQAGEGEIVVSVLDDTTWRKTANVTVTLQDEHSGLREGAALQYAWTEELNYEDATWVTANIAEYEAGANSTTFVATAAGYNGKYYLWIKTIELGDVVGNFAEEDVRVVRRYYLDNTPPQMAVTEESGEPEETDGLIRHYSATNNTGNGYSSSATTWKDLTGNYDAILPGANVTLYGDVDCDGVVTEDDGLYLLRHTMFESSYPLTSEGKANSDVNLDGILTDADAGKIVQYVEGGAPLPELPDKVARFENDYMLLDVGPSYPLNLGKLGALPNGFTIETKVYLTGDTDFYIYTNNGLSINYYCDGYLDVDITLPCGVVIQNDLYTDFPLNTLSTLSIVWKEDTHEFSIYLNRTTS